MKTLVTGVAGFIGSHIAERLIKDGHKVIGIDDLSAGYTSNIPKEVKFIHADICNINLLPEILEGVDVVFHQAASKKNICIKNPARDMEVNGIGTLKLLQQCVKMGVKKFVHASTGSVYGEVDGLTTELTARNPCSYYGISKTAGESYAMQFKDLLNVTILRYFHVYGSRQETNPDIGGVVAIFTDRINKGLPITIHGDGKQERVFTCVENIVDANIQSWLNPVSAGKIYNCASTHRTTIIQLAEMLMTKIGKRVEIIHDDPLVGDIYKFNVDSSKIHNELGVNFRPIV